MIDAPAFDLSKSAATTMFEQKDNAIEFFVANRNLTIQNIDTINSMSWLDGWIKAFGTAGETEFLKTINQTTYNEFKNFMQSLYTTKFAEYPALEVKA